MKSIRKGLYIASTVAMATAAAATYYVLVKQPNDKKAHLKRAIVALQEQEGAHWESRYDKQIRLNQEARHKQMIDP